MIEQTDDNGPGMVLKLRLILQTIGVWTLLGSIMFYPPAVFVSHMMHEPVLTARHGLRDMIVSAYSYQRIFWPLTFTVFGGLVGFFQIRFKWAVLQLIEARDDLEMQIIRRTEGLETANENLRSEMVQHERHRMEHRRLAAAVENAVEAVIITDRRGIIEYAKPAFERIRGYSRQETLDRSVRMLERGQHLKYIVSINRRIVSINRLPNLR